jgi:7-cyano-7-deazaguanine synthase
VVSALFVDYGQPDADKEAASAAAVSKHYAIELRTLALTGYEPPDGYVQGRNAVFLSLALMKTTFSCGLIALGIHGGTPYVDCTSRFCCKMQEVCDLYTGGQVQIGAPFMDWTKSEIWDYACEHGVPLDVTHTSNPDDLIAQCD